MATFRAFLFSHGDGTPVEFTFLSSALGDARHTAELWTKNGVWVPGREPRAIFIPASRIDAVHLEMVPDEPDEKGYGPHV